MLATVTGECVDRKWKYKTRLGLSCFLEPRLCPFFLLDSSVTYPQHPIAAAGGSLPAKGQIGSLWYMYDYLRPYKLAVFGACVALLFTSSAVLGLGAALRYLVDEGIAKGNPALLDNAFWLLMGVVLLLAFATFARYYLVSWVGEHVVADIRNDIYQKMMSMHAGFFETTRTGELLSRLTTDTTLLQTVVGSSVSIFLRNSILFVGGLVMLVITSWHLTEYVVILVPLVVVPIIVIGKRVRFLSRLTQNRVADLSVHAEETIGAMRTIQAMSLEDYEAWRFGMLVNRACKTSLRRIAVRALLTSIVITLVFGAIVTVLWIGGRDVVSGELSPGNLSAFIFYAVITAGALAAISEVIGELQRAAGAAERLMELMQEIPDIATPTHPKALDVPPEGLICFNDVTFHYPSRPETAALEQFSLTVEPGRTVAIVGPSGAGKTTIFQLLLRFYDPQKGNICIDNIALTDLEPHVFRRHIGLVPQDPVIFSANVWDNIRCGNPEATDDEVMDAAKAASAFDFIDTLPKGFDSYLGERGVRLSGGQKQRIAIARAIIRNPRILLLDEATSALDSENEKWVQKALEMLMKDRTTLVIAHRLSTVLKADKIVVMHEGKIDAIGTHKQLLKSSPLYKRLAELQFDLEL